MTGLPADGEDLFRTFMDQSPLTAWIVDGDDRLLYSSDPFPLSDDQVGMSMWDMVPPEHVPPYRRALHQAGTTGETQLVVAPGPRADAGGTGPGWFQAHYFPLKGGWVGGVGLDVTDLVETREKLTDSRQRIVVAGDEARRRIERNLHDGAQQRLIAQLLRLRIVQQRLGRDPAAAAELLDETMQELEEAVAELRELARGIHPSTLTQLGLEKSLRSLAGRAPVPVRVQCSLATRLPESVEVTAYFFCSEALTNMAKYAGAESGEVLVESTIDHVTVRVSDDGSGGATLERGGGMEGLRDRVEALGGRFELSERPGGGTVVRTVIPLKSAIGPVLGQ